MDLQIDCTRSLGSETFESRRQSFLFLHEPLSSKIAPRINNPCSRGVAKSSSKLLWKEESDKNKFKAITFAGLRPTCSCLGFRVSGLGFRFFFLGFRV